jgi:hypothetical protein
MKFQISGSPAGEVGPWVSISFDSNGKSHIASDMYVGYMSSAGTGVLDTFSTSKSQPDYDSSQDALYTSVKVDSSGNLQFSFVRNFQTADKSHDYQITSGETVTVGWAFGGGSVGSGANCEYDQHTKRGNANFNLIATAHTAAVVTPTDSPTPSPSTRSPTNVSPTSSPSKSPSYGSPTSPPSNSQNPQISNGGFSASWKIVGSKSNQMLFQVSGATAGVTGPWVGISFDTKGKAHVASDMYVGYVSSAGTGVLDGFSSDEEQPTYDKSQDALNSSVVVDSSGNLRFSFVRSFQTADSENDFQISAASTVNVGWAFGGGSVGSRDSFECDYHGKIHRGSANLNLVATAATPTSTTDPVTSSPVSPSPTVSQSTPASTSSPMNSQSSQLTAAGFTASWKIVGVHSNEMLFRVFGATAGISGPWVGISFDSTGKSHVLSDMYVGYMSSAGTGILDTFSAYREQPNYDKSQDAMNTSVVMDSSGNLWFSFVRKFQTSDTHDYQIVEGDTVTVGWAYGGGTAYSGAECEYDYHGSKNRGSESFNLISTAITSAPSSSVTSSPSTSEATSSPSNVPEPTQALNTSGGSNSNQSISSGSASAASVISNTESHSTTETIIVVVVFVIVCLFCIVGGDIQIHRWSGKKVTPSKNIPLMQTNDV